MHGPWGIWLLQHRLPPAGLQQKREHILLLVQNTVTACMQPSATPLALQGCQHASLPLLNTSRLFMHASTYTCSVIGPKIRGQLASGVDRRPDACRHSVGPDTMWRCCPPPRPLTVSPGSPAGVTHLRSASVVVIAVRSATTSLSCLLGRSQYKSCQADRLVPLRSIASHSSRPDRASPTAWFISRLTASSCSTDIYTQQKAQGRKHRAQKVELRAAWEESCR